MCHGEWIKGSAQDICIGITRVSRFISDMFTLAKFPVFPMLRSQKGNGNNLLLGSRILRDERIIGEYIHTDIGKIYCMYSGLQV